MEMLVLNEPSEETRVRMEESGVFKSLFSLCGEGVTRFSEGEWIESSSEHGEGRLIG